MYKVILLVALLGLCLAVNVDVRRPFKDFQRKFNKNYAADELPKRYRIFQQNMVRAEDLNRKNPLASFGVNQFSDLAPEEFAKFYLMPNVNFSRDYKAPPVKTEFPVNPKLITDSSNQNWFNQGACTPVYNQGQCGSCWAFSATETIESYYQIQGNSLTQLSMEQIVDCDTTCNGCEGGMPSSAYTYVQSAGGIDSYSSYPYTAGGGQAGQCAFNKANVVTNVASQQAISGETGLYQQSSSAGPVSVCVDASSWQSYNSGVLTQCGNQVDHCVQLVGYANYGQSGSYWIVRNSWGTSWGQQGFIFIAIGQDLCSIGDYATIVADT